MKNITIKPSATIKEAMELLDKTAEKVLLVIAADKKLIGTLTDGDIRRHILKDQNLTAYIKNIYKRDPVFVFQEDFNSENIKKVFTENKINLIPVLDKNKRIIEYLSWEKVFVMIETRKNKK